MIFSKFDFYLEVTLSKLINFYSPWNHKKAYGFQMISEWIEVN